MKSKKNNNKKKIITKKKFKGGANNAHPSNSNNNNEIDTIYKRLEKIENILGTEEEGLSANRYLLLNAIDSILSPELYNKIESEMEKKKEARSPFVPLLDNLISQQLIQKIYDNPPKIPLLDYLLQKSGVMVTEGASTSNGIDEEGNQ